MNKKEILYFEKPGIENVDNCIDSVQTRLKENDIKHIVIASSTGETALKLRNAINDQSISITCVSLNKGSKWDEEFNKNRSELEKNNIKIVTCGHSLSGVERSVASRWGGSYPQLLISDVFRLFSEGMKVSIEVLLMATDSGNVPVNEQVISIGGSSKGCDTAIVVNSAYSRTLLQDLGINEILCLPKTNGIKHKAN